MPLMDVPDPAPAPREAARVLRPGGFLRLSIPQPCSVPPHRRVLREPDGGARCFDEADGREDVWWFTAPPRGERDGVRPFRIPRFHRTPGAWVDTVPGTGLAIEALAEPRPSAEAARAVPLLADAAAAPPFPHPRARKPRA